MVVRLPRSRVRPRRCAAIRHGASRQGGAALPSQGRGASDHHETSGSSADSKTNTDFMSLYGGYPIVSYDAGVAQGSFRPPPARMLCRSGPSGHVGIFSPCHSAHGHSSAADTSVHMNPGINPTDPARNAGHLDQARGTDRQVGSADGKPEVRGTNLYPLSVSPRTSQ